MSQAASQAAAFYRDVAEHRRLWTIRDSGAYPAPMTRSGAQSQPFWSTLSRVKRILKNVPEYSGFEPIEMSWKRFRVEILPGLRHEHMLVGVNWSGPNASGYDLEPDWVQHSVQVEIENRGGPPATPLERVKDEHGLASFRLKNG